MSDIDQVHLTTLLGTSDIDQVDLTTLVGTLRFYSRFRGEIPPSICAKAADRIAELEAALKPFAEVATRLGWDKLDDEDPVLEEHIIDAPADDIAPGAFYCLMVQPFREARAALQAKGER